MCRYPSPDKNLTHNSLKVMSNKEILNNRINQLESERTKLLQDIHKARIENASKDVIKELQKKYRQSGKAIQGAKNELWDIQISLFRGFLSNNWKFLTVCGLFVFSVPQISEAIISSRYNTNTAIRAPAQASTIYQGDSPESARIKAAAIKATAHSSCIAAAWRTDQLMGKKVCDERFGNGALSYTF